MIYPYQFKTIECRGGLGLKEREKKEGGGKKEGEKE